MHKLLAHAGVGSRRHCEELIAQGRVTVNGQPATIGQAVSEGDEVRLDGRPVQCGPQASVYYVLNKPAGVISSAKDECGRKSVLDLVPARERVYPVGRLDADSEGLILLTNDGELAHRLTHPRYQVPKQYEVRVVGQVAPASLQRLLEGIELEDGMARMAQAQVLATDKGSTLLRVSLTEGKKREIRRLFQALGHPVLGLRRVAIGPLRLGRLRTGQWRALSPGEAANLARQVGLIREGGRG